MNTGRAGLIVRSGSVTTARPSPGRSLLSYRLCVASLLREAAPDLDADYTGDALLVGLGAEFVAHLREDRGMTLEQIADGFENLVRLLTTSAG